MSDVTPPESPQRDSRRAEWFKWVRENAFNFVIVAIVILVIGVFAYALLSGTAGILDKLSKTETARGLITFIFTFGVISIAFILILALFFSKSEDIIDRFDKAKEVYTGLIVILGTIMGFYFGVEVGNQQAEAVTQQAESIVKQAKAVAETSNGLSSLDQNTELNNNASANEDSGSVSDTR